MERPALLTRPLGNTVAKPLRTAVLWGFLASAVGAAVAFGVGGVAYLVGLVGSLFGDGTARWSWDLVGDVGAVLAMLTVVSSTWAAAFGSTHLAPTGRAAAGAALGVAVLAAMVRFESPAALLAAAAAGWTVAVPFERWSRAFARLAACAGMVALVAVAFRDAGVLATVAIVAVSYPLAALTVGLGDVAWRTANRRSERDGGESDEPG